MNFNNNALMNENEENKALANLNEILITHSKQSKELLALDEQTPTSPKRDQRHDDSRTSHASMTLHRSPACQINTLF